MPNGRPNVYRDFIRSLPTYSRTKTRTDGYNEILGKPFQTSVEGLSFTGTRGLGKDATGLSTNR